MTVNHTATAGHDVKLALYRLAQDLYADPAGAVLVSYGYPGSGMSAADIVALLEVRTEQEPATVSPKRSRDEFVYVTVLFSCHRAGFAEDDLVPATAATGLLQQLEEAVRDDPTIGGLVYWCFLETTRSAGVTDSNLLTKGRLIQLEAEFKAKVRITS